MKLFFFIAAMTLVLCGPISSFAQTDKAAAQKQYKKGLKYFDQEAYDEAAAAFRRANELNFHWKVLYNIGQSEAAARRFGAALEAFEEYLSRGGDDISVERNEEVLAEIARLRMMSGYLIITAPENTTIIIDGLERGVTPLSTPVPVAASVDHELVAVNGGNELLRRTIKVLGKQSTEITVTDGESTVNESEAPDDGDNASAAVGISEIPGEGSGTNDESPMMDDGAAQSTSAPSKGLKTAGLVTMTTGVLATMTGCILGIKALADNRTLKSDCGGTDCYPAYHNDVDDLHDMGNASTILISAGAAVAVTGLVLLLVQRKRQHREVNTSAAVVIQPHQSTAIMEWSF